MHVIIKTSWIIRMLSLFQICQDLHLQRRRCILCHQLFERKCFAENSRVSQIDILWKLTKLFDFLQIGAKLHDFLQIPEFLEIGKMRFFVVKLPNSRNCRNSRICRNFRKHVLYRIMIYLSMIVRHFNVIINCFAAVEAYFVFFSHSTVVPKSFFFNSEYNSLLQVIYHQYNGCR